MQYNLPICKHEVLFSPLNLTETRSVREIISEYSFDLLNVHLWFLHGIMFIGAILKYQATSKMLLLEEN